MVVEVLDPLEFAELSESREFLPVCLSEGQISLGCCIGLTLRGLGRREALRESSRR